MELLKKIFSNQSRHSLDRGDSGNGSGGGEMRSIPVKIIEEPDQLQNEGSSIEKEERKALIEKSFLKVFNKGGHKDITIYSQNKGGETPIGNYLNAAFFTNNAGDILLKMFLEKFSNDEKLSEENIRERIKKFCLENIEDIKCNSEGMKLAMIAVCKKGIEEVPVDVIDQVEIDEFVQSEKLEAEKKMRDRVLEQRLTLVANLHEMIEGEIKRLDPKKDELLEEVTFLEELDEVRSDDLDDENNEKIQKAIQQAKASVSQVWNLKKKQFDDFNQVQSRKNKMQESKKEVKSIYESRLEFLENIYTVWEQRIKECSEDKLKPDAYYRSKVGDVNKNGLSQEEIVKLDEKILEKQNKISELLSSIILEKKNEKNEIAAKKFSAAAGRIEKMDLSKSEYEKQFQPLSVQIDEGDMAAKLLKFAEVLEGHHDSVSEAEIKTFWENFKKYESFVERVNDPNYPKELVVVEGHTYAVNKEIEKKDDDIVDTVKQEFSHVTDKQERNVTEEVTEKEKMKNELELKVVVEEQDFSHMTDKQEGFEMGEIVDEKKIEEEQKKENIAVKVNHDDEQDFSHMTDKQEGFVSGEVADEKKEEEREKKEEEKFSELPERISDAFKNYALTVWDSYERQLKGDGDEENFLDRYPNETKKQQLVRLLVEPVLMEKIQEKSEYLKQKFNIEDHEIAALADHIMEIVITSKNK